MRSTLDIVLTAVFAALTTVATVVIAVPIPMTGGYLNFGDAMVMVSGMLLGPMGGLLAGGIGSAMGDVALGYVHFAPITFVVKGLEGLVVGVFSARASRMMRITLTDTVGLVLAAGVMMLGYMFFETILFGFPAALAELLTANWIQVTVGAIIAGTIGPILRLYLRGLTPACHDRNTESPEPFLEAQQ
jgi:uncharacterized membrane protein